MQLPNLSLSYLLLELKPLENCFVQKVQLVDESTLRLQLKSKEKGRLDWVIAPQTAWLSKLKIPARPSTGFAAFLDKHLNGQKLETIEQHGQDRVLVARFSKHDLVVELFADGNIILCDKNKIILQPFHRQEWKDRKLWKGEQYKFPAAKENLLEENSATLLKNARSATGSFVSFLVSRYGLAPLAGEEIALRAGILKGMPAGKLSEKEAESVLRSAREVLSATPKNLAPQKAEFQGETWLLPFVFRSVACSPIESFSSALDARFSAPAQKVESKKQKGLQQSMAQQETAKLKFVQDAEEFQRSGEWLKSHATEVQALIDWVKREKAGGKSWKEIDVLLARKSVPLLHGFGSIRLDGGVLRLQSDGSV